MPRNTDSNPLALARQLDAWGFNVLPAPPRQKSPRVEWKRWTTDRATRMLPNWFGQSTSNYWIATGGISGCYVLDIDNDETDAWWRTLPGIPELFNSTVRARTAKGTHYYFHVPASDQAKGWAYHEGSRHFDVRGTGGGVIVPPSIHETGVVYEWIQAPDPDQPLLGMQPCPDWLKSREGVREYQSRGRGADPHAAPAEPLKTADTEPLKSNTASMLSALLNRPPVGEGGRNDWLTRVAGHYAKTYRQQQDLYILHVKQAAAMLQPPLAQEEIAKTLNSIWTKEIATHPERDIESTGWLLSAGDRILTQTKTGRGEESELIMQEWSDFDLRVQGVMANDGNEGDLMYDVLLRRKRGGEPVEAILPGKVLGAPPKLMAWLGGHGVSISRPDGCYPTNPPDAVRLLRYLDSQEAPRSRMVRALGFDETSGSFLTYDGIIEADGPHPFRDARPNPELRGFVNFHYGFEGTWDEAREVLREVLTFHEESIAAVFGAWWAACLLKPQLQRQLSMFPVMAVEAASGAGKTNGMFGMLLQLAGSVEGPGIMTMASARDRIASHQNGITWMDDLEELGRIKELVRITTSQEGATKKDIDNHGNVTAQLVSPVVLSGEYLGLGDQKATLDRSILINPPKPDGRMSLKPGRESMPQWDDIVQLTNRYAIRPDGKGGLAVLAGHYVQHALKLQDAALARLHQMRSEVLEDVAEHQGRTKSVSGRQADKIAVLLIGAWLLDRLTDDYEGDAEIGPWEARVRRWAQTAEAFQTAGEWDNRLTLEILPWALRTYGWPNTARGGTPVFVKEASDLLGPEVWVSVPRLAEAWREHMRGRIVERTDTEKALLDQVKRCQDTPRSARVDVSRTASRTQMLFWCLPPEVSQVLIDRSEGMA